MPSPKTRFLLDEEHAPKRYYNLLADLKVLPPPPLHPGTQQGSGSAAEQGLAGDGAGRSRRGA
jgi:hypothetical protein